MAHNTVTSTIDHFCTSRWVLETNAFCSIKYNSLRRSITDCFVFLVFAKYLLFRPCVQLNHVKFSFFILFLRCQFNVMCTFVCLFKGRNMVSAVWDWIQANAYTEFSEAASMLLTWWNTNCSRIHWEQSLNGSLTLDGSTSAWWGKKRERKKTETGLVLRNHLQPR